MAAKISVIMPIYNCEQTLEAALQSVLSQSVSDLELIAVEDCSADASREILLRAAERDPRIRAICNEKNLGVAAVRNIALSHVSGEYIAFCDSDDTVPAGAYEKLLRAIGDRDVAIGTHRNVYVAADGSRTSEEFPFCGASRESLFPAMLSGTAVLCTKLMRTRFVAEHALRFDETMTIGEDVIFLAEMIAKKPSYATVDEVVYLYYQRKSDANRSLTHTYTLHTYRKLLECQERLLTICADVPECRDYVYERAPQRLEQGLHFLTDREERTAAFLLFREFMSGYDFTDKPLLFSAITGTTPECFSQMDADRYFESHAEMLPRERVALEFECGMIGLRWIVRYFKGWLRFKFRR